MMRLLKLSERRRRFRTLQKELSIKTERLRFDGILFWNQRMLVFLILAKQKFNKSHVDHQVSALNTDATSRLILWLHELPNGIEYRFELRIVFSLQIIQPS